MLTMILIALMLVAIAMLAGIWMSCGVFAEALSRKLWADDEPSSSD